MKELRTSTARHVLQHVSERTGVPVAAILAKRSPPKLLAPIRRRAIRLFDRLGYSSVDIGYAMERHHTTVLHHLGRLS